MLIDFYTISQIQTALIISKSDVWTFQISWSKTQVLNSSALIFRGMLTFVSKCQTHQLCLNFSCKYLVQTDLGWPFLLLVNVQLPQRTGLSLDSVVFKAYTALMLDVKCQTFYRSSILWRLKNFIFKKWKPQGKNYCSSWRNIWWRR